GRHRTAGRAGDRPPRDPASALRTPTSARDPPRPRAEGTRRFRCDEPVVKRWRWLAMAPTIRFEWRECRRMVDSRGSRRSWAVPATLVAMAVYAAMVALTTQ